MFECDRILHSCVVYVPETLLNEFQKVSSDLTGRSKSTLHTYTANRKTGRSYSEKTKNVRICSFIVFKSHGLLATRRSPRAPNGPYTVYIGGHVSYIIHKRTMRRRSVRSFARVGRARTHARASPRTCVCVFKCMRMYVCVRVCVCESIGSAVVLA